MFITVVFNTEYMDMASRKMWYLKNLFHCKENGWILITHDYIRKHFEELQDSITDRFIDQFEMKRFTLEELKDVEQYFVPDEIFDDREKEDGSRTEMLFDLYSQPNKELDKCLNDIFFKIEQHHPNEKIEGVFNCLEGFESLRNISERYHCPLINYSFSAFRKVHGYRQTLYTVNLKTKFWDGKECEERYNEYLKEGDKTFPIFSNEELVAIIGKEHTLPLIKLIKSEPKYEMVVCCECFSLVPTVFNKIKYTDDDILYECKKLFGADKLKVRSHVIHLNDIQVDRNEVHNDPASTILSCKRVTAVQSQILLKSLLWNRTTIMKTNGLALSFLCEKEMDSVRKPPIKGLNYFIFCFLIPSELMFSDDYWKWRLTSPTEAEIYQRHMDFLLDKLNIDKTKTLQLKGKERLRYLLECRNCDEQLIETLQSDEVLNNINWDVVSSKFEIISHEGVKSYWRIDEKNDDGSLTTTLSVKVSDALKLKFYPLFDVSGFACLKNVTINGKAMNLGRDETSFKYMPKDSGTYDFYLENSYTGFLTIECTWLFKKVYQYLNDSIRR